MVSVCVVGVKAIEFNGRGIHNYCYYYYHYYYYYYYLLRFLNREVVSCTPNPIPTIKTIFGAPYRTYGESGYSLEPSCFATHTLGRNYQKPIPKRRAKVFIALTRPRFLTRFRPWNSMFCSTFALQFLLCCRSHFHHKKPGGNVQKIARFA